MAAADGPVKVAQNSRRGRWLMLHHGLVGGVLAVPLALWASGLVFHVSVAAQADQATYQLAMWSVVPLWALAAGLAFLAPSRRACWAWLLGANVVAASLLHGLIGWAR